MRSFLVFISLLQCLLAWSAGGEPCASPNIVPIPATVSRTSDDDGLYPENYESWKDDYRIRAVIRILRPVDTDFANDGIQTVSVLNAQKDSVDLEVVFAPFAMQDRRLVPNMAWQADYQHMDEWLRPGITCNWDAKLRNDILVELEKQGVGLTTLSDMEVVREVSKWALSRVQQRKMFTTMLVHFPQAKPAVLPGLEEAFWRNRGAYEWDPETQFSHELFGKEMFYNRTIGECASASIYLTTVLRAVGVPTRMIMNIPPIDPSRDEQIVLLKKGIRQPQVRHLILAALNHSEGGLVSHMSNEVFVANTWVRLNYDDLNHSVISDEYLGLMTRTNTYADWSDLGIAETWGAFYARKAYSDLFPGDNPYYALELEDYVLTSRGRRMPPVREHQVLTIIGAYDFNSPDRPRFIPHMNTDEGTRLALIRVREWLPDDNYLQLRDFIERADGKFHLVCGSDMQFEAEVTGTIYTYPDEGVRDIGLKVGVFANGKSIDEGTAYEIRPVNRSPYKWRVSPGVRLVWAGGKTSN